MEYDDYLRDLATKYRKLAQRAVKPPVKAELFELAVICEEVANRVEDRMTAG